MIKNLLLIVKPIVSYSSWNKRNLSSTNYFKAVWNFIIRQSNYIIFSIFYFDLKSKSLWKTIGNFYQILIKAYLPSNNNIQTIILFFNYFLVKISRCW